MKHNIYDKVILLTAHEIANLISLLWCSSLIFLDNWELLWIWLREHNWIIKVYKFIKCIIIFIGKTWLFLCSRFAERLCLQTPPLCFQTSSDGVWIHRKSWFLKRPTFIISDRQFRPKTSYSWKMHMHDLLPPRTLEYWSLPKDKFGQKSLQ